MHINDLTTKTIFSRSTDDYDLTVDATGNVALLEIRFKRAMVVTPYQNITYVNTEATPFRNVIISNAFNANYYVEIRTGKGIYCSNTTEIPLNATFHGAYLLAY